MVRRLALILGMAWVLYSGGGCVQTGRYSEPVLDRPAIRGGRTVEQSVPLGLPPVPYPEGGAPTMESWRLGRRLFFDPVLSSDRTISCASCHQPTKWFSDGLQEAKGVGGQTGRRNTPGILNAAYWPRQFWDGRAADLEEQASGPIASPAEMNLPHKVCLERLEADGSYREEFRLVFGPGPITMGRVVRAIASYERTLLSGNSPFDRYYYGRDKAAMSGSAIRGLDVFRNPAKGNCAACHQIGETAALFTDGLFHNLGAGMDASGELKDAGRYEQTRVEGDRGAFRTPSLRSVAQTAPYMHDGGLKTLREVIDFYIGGGSSNPQLDPLIRPLTLTARERDDLEAFLQALTGLEALTGEVPEGEK